MMSRNGDFQSLAVYFCGLLFWSAFGASLNAQGSQTELDKVLQKMEAAGKGFQSFQAQLIQKKYIAVLKEYDTEEKGSFAYMRAPDGLALIRKEITQPSPIIAIINRDQGLVYYPKIKQAQRMRLGQHKDKAEFMAVGVGQSASKMKENFQIRLIGRESIDGVSCAVLELRPKSEKTAAFLSVITLWFDEQRWIPLQSRLQEPNEDYLLTRFSEIKLNTKLPDSLFSLKLPSGVEVIGE
jgi:outer membrane lipoprotein-sorting protein